MYKGTHQSAQRRADALTPKNLMLGGEELLTPEQKRENLVSAKKKIEAECIALPKKDPRRKKLGQKLLELNKQINAIRAARRSSSEIKDYYITAAKELVGMAMHKLIMDRAAKMMQEQQTKGTGDSNEPK